MPLVVPSFYITVKYLREVTPYFRKASVMADIGWELQSGFLGAENGFLAGDEERQSPVMTNGPDTRSVPLLFCHLTRNYKCDGEWVGRVSECVKTLVFLCNVNFTVIQKVSWECGVLGVEGKVHIIC